MFSLFRESAQSNGRDLFLPPTLGDTYKSILQKHSAQRINRVIANDSFEDSSSVYERFFTDCKQEIRIIARGIKPEILDRQNVINSARGFLQREGSKLIIDIPAQDNAEVYHVKISEFMRAVFDVSGSDEKIKANFYRRPEGRKFLDDLPSITVGDGRMYRMRSYQSDGDYSTHANAEVNFNDPSKVEELLGHADISLKSETLL